MQINVRGGFNKYSLLNTQVAFNSAWALRMHGIGPASQAAKHHSFLTKPIHRRIETRLGWVSRRSSPGVKNSAQLLHVWVQCTCSPLHQRTASVQYGVLRHMGTERRVRRTWVLVSQASKVSFALSIAGEKPRGGTSLVPSPVKKRRRRCGRMRHTKKTDKGN